MWGPKNEGRCTWCSQMTPLLSIQKWQVNWIQGTWQRVIYCLITCIHLFLFYLYVHLFLYLTLYFFAMILLNDFIISICHLLTSPWAFEFRCGTLLLEYCLGTFFLCCKCFIGYQKSSELFSKIFRLFALFRTVHYLSPPYLLISHS